MQQIGHFSPSKPQGGLSRGKKNQNKNFGGFAELFTFGRDKLCALRSPGSCRDVGCSWGALPLLGEVGRVSPLEVPSKQSNGGTGGIISL